MRLSLISALLLLAALWLADSFYPLSITAKDADFATVVVDQEGYPLRAFADKNGLWRYKVKLDEVSPYYIDALLAYEDRYFYYHPGVNPFSLLRAIWQFLSNGQVVSGGSTLTMQVARILYPHQRSVTGKLQQILRALQLEWHLSKQEILTLYLNYAPFGGTIEGVQAASYLYLRKPVSELRAAEAALLAVLPQAPSRYRPDRYPKRAQQARDKVIDRLVAFQYWDKTTAGRVKQEPVSVWKPQQPFVAPLLARRLQQALAKQRLINSYINRDLQQRIASYIKDYVSLQGEDVSAAVLVVDNNTQQVIAYIGSADMADEKRAGHVDMIQAVRSPGSTLKPFLYGLAIDKGLIHSSSLLADVPRVNSYYRPGNFSDGFAGPITASDALQRSLNIPFVQLIEAYGEQDFVNKFAHVLQPLTVPENKANPAIILGGVGTTLESLVTLYSNFVNQGRVKALQFSPQIKTAAGRELLSPEAAWITWSTLTGVEVPESYRGGLSSSQRPIIGWKTGTSWGNRDTWSIGSSKQHTIGVWVGRPSGAPLKGALGISTAAPVLFSVLTMLDAVPSAIDRPDTVEDKIICWPDGRAQSLVEGSCDRKLLAKTKQGITPRTLEIESGLTFFKSEQVLMVNKDSQLRVNDQCNTNDIEQKTVTLWPKQFEPWLVYSERRSARLPKYDNSCLAIPLKADQLTIIGIEPQQQLFAIKGISIQLMLQVAGAVGKVSWYLNGQRVAIQSGPLTLTLPEHFIGDAELVVIDESGLTGRVQFSVNQYQ